MKKLRALFIEDRPDDVTLIVKQLGRGGYEVEYERVETEEELEQALERDGWEVILSDYSMPRFSAPLALETFKRLHKDLPFIVVSGTVGEDVAVEMMRRGAHDYILKGNLTRLCMAVARELGDVEQRKQRAVAEAALKESEARFLRLVENVPDIIYRLRLGSSPTLEYISPAVQRVCGYQPQALIGRGGAIFQGLHPDSRTSLQALLARGDLSWGQLQWLHKSGEVRWLDHRNTPIVNDSGEVVAIEGAARDVTEQRQLEEQLEVAQRMEAVGQLAGGVAHDFNNLLTVINSLADMRLEEPLEDEEVMEDFQQIRDAGAAATKLTNQLLAFSRRQIRKVEAVDVNAVVAEVERMLGRIIGEDLILTTVLCADLPLVDMDGGQLEQVIVNLAVNVRDAMPRGGKLTIETALVDLDDDYARSHLDVTAGRYIMLAISDDGCGMTEETRAHVFEPFFTTKKMGKGTGLGLSMVCGIVKQSDGHIFVGSEVGKGTVFKMYLPESKGRSRGAMRPSVPPTSTSGTETVLLVEDSVSVREVAMRSLRKAGYRVIEASDPQDAACACPVLRRPNWAGPSASAGWSCSARCIG